MTVRSPNAAPILTLPQLLATARALAWSRFGQIVRLSTLDGETWQCLAVDPETAAHDESAPTGVGTDATGHAAVAMFVDAVHEVEHDAEADRRANLTTLREAYPVGVTFNLDDHQAEAVDAPAAGERVA